MGENEGAWLYLDCYPSDARKRERGAGAERAGSAMAAMASCWSQPAPPPSWPRAGAATDVVQQALGAAEAALGRHFGFGELRPFQREAVAAWAQGRDALMTLATGAGKSLCFQLPPLCAPDGRWALVISPLVALMQDQVSTLRQRQIRAGLCGSGARGDAAASWAAMRAGDFKIVYMCPEFALRHLAELAELSSAICLLAVDEAHCVSSWGQDFRPSYLRLASLREAFPGVPTMCVTATCTPRVRADIERFLALRPGFASVVGTMNRPNLKFVVRERTSYFEDLGELFGACGVAGGRAEVEARRALHVENDAPGPTSSAIVYVARQKDCERLAAWLAERGVRAAAYHAGLPMAERCAALRAKYHTPKYHKSEIPF